VSCIFSVLSNDLPDSERTQLNMGEMGEEGAAKKQLMRSIICVVDVDFAVL
jgi:hypothetical protein